jgi:nucleoid-associated protein Lsr2
LTSCAQVRTLGRVATTTKVVLVDDLTGEPADTTVRFALDKTEYEIDLSNDNASELRGAFARYVAAGRKTAPRGGRPGAQPEKRAYSGYDPAAVRAWAAGQGIKVSPRGRIRADVVEQYRAAGN